MGVCFSLASLVYLTEPGTLHSSYPSSAFFHGPNPCSYLVGCRTSVILLLPGNEIVILKMSRWVDHVGSSSLFWAHMLGTLGSLCSRVVVDLAIWSVAFGEVEDTCLCGQSPGLISLCTAFIRTFYRPWRCGRCLPELCVGL